MKYWVLDREAKAHALGERADQQEALAAACLLGVDRVLLFNEQDAEFFRKDFEAEKLEAPRWLQVS